MNLLAIETSSPVLSVAIRQGDFKIREITIRDYRKHAENILPAIDRLLKYERLKIRDINAFLIGRGPGSFTGLRVGFATLKGFLAIHSKPCYGALSLDLIASGITPPLKPGLRSKAASETGFQKGSNLTVCLDAKRGKLYTRSYHERNGKWLPDGPSRVVLAEEMARQIPQGSRVTGDGIKKINAGNFEVAPEKNWFPRASFLIRLFEARNPFLKKLAQPKEILPVYLRSSEPEEKLAERKKHA